MHTYIYIYIYILKNIVFGIKTKLSDDIGYIIFTILYIHCYLAELEGKQSYNKNSTFDEFIFESD